MNMQYQAGDIALFTGFDFFSIFIKIGNWWSMFRGKEEKWLNITHAGIMVSNTEIVEALSKGVQISQLPTKNFWVYRKKNLAEEQKDKLKSTAFSFVKEPYSFWLIACLVVLKFFRLEYLFKGMGYKGEICSVLVAKCYEKIKYYFSPIKCVDLISPADLAYHVINNKEWELIN